MAAAERQQHAVCIGVRFLKEFYENLALAPADVAGYYADKCSLMDIEEGALVDGLPAVHDYYENKPAGAKYAFSKVIAHPSGEGMMVVAWGTQLLPDRTRDFQRTFILQPTRDPSEGEEAPMGYRAGTLLFSVVNDVLEWRGEYEADPPKDTPAAVSPGKTTAAARVTSSQAASPGRAGTASTTSPSPKAAAPAAAQETAATSKAPRPLTWAEKASASLGATLYSTAATVCQRVVGGGEKGEEMQPPKPVQDVRGRAAAGPPPSTSRRDMSPSEKYQYAALYISGVPPDMTEADIDRLFKPFGTIKGKTFRQGAYCFIDYEDKASVRAACTRGPIKFKNVTLTVQERKSPEQRAAEKERNNRALLQKKR